MPEKKSVWSGAVFFLGMVAVLLVLFVDLDGAKGETITVDDDGKEDYETIQDAIDAAEEGDTIRVFEGEYFGNLMIDKRLKLVGDGRTNTIVCGNGTGPVVKIGASWVNMSGFALQNGSTGLRIESHGNTLSGLNVSDLQGNDGAPKEAGGTVAGIYLFHAENNSFDDIVMYNLTAGNGGDDDTGGKGKIGGVAAGFSLEDSNGNTFTNSKLSNFTGGTGGSIDGSYGGSGEGGPAAGFYLLNSSDNRFEENEIFCLTGGFGGLSAQHNGGSGGVAAGFLLDNSPGNTISRNDVHDLIGGKGGDATNNDCGGAGGIVAGTILEGAGDNIVSGNSFSRLSGGQGGKGGKYTGSRGTGGVCTGIILQDSTHNSFEKNAITSLDDMGGGVHGFSTAVWIRDQVSVSNLLTPVEVQDGWNVPNIDCWNTVEGAPVLCFYNISELKVQDINASSGVVPLTIGGDQNSGGQSKRTGSGGISVGLYLLEVNDTLIENTTVGGYVGMPGGAGGDTGSTYGFRGAGGLTTGIYLQRSSNITLERNRVLDITGGTGGSVGNYIRAGKGGAAAAIYILESNDLFLGNTMLIDITGGAGGAGSGAYRGNEGSAFGIYLESSRNVSLEGNTVERITGGYGSPGGGNPGGGFGGAGCGISITDAMDIDARANIISNVSSGLGQSSRAFFLGDSISCRFEGNTITRLVGGPGKPGGFSYHDGGTGGAGVGFYLTGSNTNEFGNNTIQNIRSGGGGDGGSGTSKGAAGGVCAGFYVHDSDNNLFTGNTVGNLSAGGGGTGSGAPGGVGGVATGVYLKKSTGNQFQNTAMSSFTGGEGAPTGADGFSTGIWIRDGVSMRNSLTPLTTEGSWMVPDTRLLNTVNGAPVLYFYDTQAINLSGFKVISSTTTGLTIGGDTASGGTGGISTMLYLGSVSDSIIIENTLGGERDSGDDTGTEGYVFGSFGGADGVTAGIYVVDSVNVSLENNTISNIAGGNSGASNSGGRAGGTGAGVFLEDSTGCRVKNNNIFNISGGRGGSGSRMSKDGGAGGVGAAVYLFAADSNTVGSNLLTSIMGGGGGKGGGNDRGGAGGAAAGIYLHDSTKNQISNNTMDHLVEGKIGAVGSDGAEGEHGFGAGFVLENSRENTILGNGILALTHEGAEVWASGEHVVGIFLKDLGSVDNLLTPTTEQDGWNVPDPDQWNTINGTPILCFHDVSRIRVSGLEIISGQAPFAFEEDGRAPSSTGLYLHGVRDSVFEDLAIGGFVGFQGAPGKSWNIGAESGGVATGIFFQETRNNSVVNNTIFKLTGGPGGSGPGESSDWSGARGGVGCGLYFRDSMENHISNNTIHTMDGGVGGDNSEYLTAGEGGCGCGIYLDNSLNNLISTNTISNLTGGLGGVGDIYGSSGGGGLAVGIYYKDSHDNTASHNRVSKLWGGKGGQGPYYSSGGRGGIGVGMYLTESENNSFLGNSLWNLSGGLRGLGGENGYHGANGTACGFWLSDGESWNNNITYLKKKDSWWLPDPARLNTLDNTPILFFSGCSSLKVSHFVISSGFVPLVVYEGHTGDMLSTGLFLNNASDSVIEDTIITGFCGLAGATGNGVSGMEGTGLFVKSSVNITVSNLTVSSLAGGAGGAARAYYDNPGGSGGAAVGIHLLESRNCTLDGNRLFDISGGVGGPGAVSGYGGFSTGYFLDLCRNNLMKDTRVSDISGGKGGGWYSGAEGGRGLGIYLRYSSANTLDGNSIRNVTGGAGGDANGELGSGGYGGAGAGIFLNRSSRNIFTRNTLSGVMGGKAGEGSSPEVAGAEGRGTAIWISDTDSLENLITPVRNEGNEMVPDPDFWNVIDGSPILCFYNLSKLRVSGLTVSTSCAPITFWEEGLAKNMATGICLWNVSDSVLEGLTVEGFEGHTGGTISSHTSKPGHPCSGIFISNSTAIVIENSTLRELKGGLGGNRMNSGSGGEGGTGIGIFLYHTTNCSLYNNRIVNVSGGAGGMEGRFGAPGDGGDCAAVVLNNTRESSVSNIHVHNLSAGVRGDSGDEMGTCYVFYLWKAHQAVFTDYNLSGQESSREGSRIYDLVVLGGSSAETINSTITRAGCFCDSRSELVVKNYIQIKAAYRNGTVIFGVDVRIKDHGKLVYATEHFGGDDSKTDEAGFSGWVLVTCFTYPNDHVIRVDLWAETIEFEDNHREVDMTSSHTELFLKGRPLARILSITPSSVMKSHTITFEAYKEANVQRFLWSSSLNGVLYDGNSSGFFCSNLTNGTHEIFLMVQDEDEIWSEIAVGEVRVNGWAVASILSVSPDPVSEGEEVLFTGIGTDDGTITRYVWRSDIDGEFYNGSQAEFSYAGLSAGSHTLYFKVGDNYAVWSRVVNTSLLIHTQPTASIVAVTPNPAFDTDSLRYEENSTDDGTIQVYLWRIENSTGFEVYNGTTPPATFPAGYYTVYLMVQDNYGVWSEEVNISLIVYQWPVAVMDSHTPTHALEKETIVFKGVGKGEAPIVRYVWTSSIDGDIFSGRDERFSYFGLSLGNHTISFKVLDDDGIWSKEVQAVLVIHQQPVAGILSISPDPALDTGTVEFTGEGDDDGDVVLYLWVSDLDDDLYNGTHSSFTRQGLSVGTHTISLKVQDNYGVWSEAATASLTITQYHAPNKIPMVTITVPGNGSEVKGKLVLSGNTSDDDGAIEKVEIAIDGGEWIVVRGITPWNYEWDSTTVENGNHEILVRSFDGEDYSEEARWNVIVNNRKDAEKDDESSGMGFWVVVVFMLMAMVGVFFRVFLGSKQRT